jgi:hypothetical protein
MLALLWSLFCQPALCFRSRRSSTAWRCRRVSGVALRVKVLRVQTLRVCAWLRP